MVLIMIPQIVINIFGIRLTARLNDFSVYWHIGGVAIIALLLTVFGTHHNSLEFLFSRATVVNPLDASSTDLGTGVAQPALVFGEFKLASPLFALLPWLKELYRAAPFGLVFVLALLQAQWTYTGYDASAHVAEETVMARKNSAWGVFLSVAVSAVVGYVMLLIFTWCIPNGDVATTANDEGDLGLVVDLLAGGRQLHRGAGGHERVTELREKGGGGGKLLPGLLGMGAVVEPNAHDLVRIGDGRQQLDFLQRHAFAGRRRRGLLQRSGGHQRSHCCRSALAERVAGVEDPAVAQERRARPAG